jgi:hypothetical protein
LLEFEHESVVLKIIAGRASGGLRGPVTGLRTPLVDEGVLKKATGKEEDAMFTSYLVLLRRGFGKSSDRSNLER